MQLEDHWRGARKRRWNLCKGSPYKLRKKNRKDRLIAHHVSVLT